MYMTNLSINRTTSARSSRRLSATLAISMSQPDIKLIEHLYSIGRAADLYALITGDSPFTLPEGTGDNYPRRSEGRSFDEDENHIRRMAEEHLWFVSEFGFDVTRAKRDEKFYSAYPDYFRKWLAIGCKGVHQEEIDAYLKEHPIKC